MCADARALHFYSVRNQLIGNFKELFVDFLVITIVIVTEKYELCKILSISKMLLNYS
jgi:hypothetical protein